MSDSIRGRVWCTVCEREHWRSGGYVTVDLGAACLRFHSPLRSDGPPWLWREYAGPVREEAGR